ncbi:putative glutamine amidotransferase [Marinospirillum celere]|uniref:Putative glutamine amidotransferase n=1 Tax=Marinospirillum celere TaxID=1122252 RepID=A0A1I1JJM7_9GAMM|nr:gamma-glutamyl-gamma-aminobutyrate hydrolase family protein [Marinospirillum celere]SFC48162.1 putative glutamine amidotransferase [Marinospirillum celere]
MAKPIIAITGPEKGAFGPRFLVALAVRLYGGQPLQLRPSQKPADNRFDGVVVTGGHDIDPVLYAAQPEVEPRYDAARDKLEMAVIDLALTKGLPILGICRGAQLMNVYRGGTLYQELHGQREKTSHRWTILPLKTLCVHPKTWLAEFMGSQTARINSLHNQAINETGAGFKVSGTDLDGIVQAIEDPEYGFLIGVQWHPEFLLFLKKQRQLFKALIAATANKLN